MPKKDFEQQTSYPSDISELTGLEDAHHQEEPGIWGKLVRLVSGAPAEEHDKGRALRRAVRAQDLELLQQMIAKGYGVNESQEASLACIAARRQNLEMLKLLVEAGVDHNRPDRRSQTSKARSALQEASRKGWVEGVQLLLELGSDVDACEEGDVTALHIAARLGHAEVVHLLLRHRADPCGARQSHTSPLHETASPKIMQMLLQAGAMINQRDRNKCAPLHLQTYCGRPETVEILLNHNADINSVDRKGRPALFLLGGRGDLLKVYELFKKKGINYSTRDLNENTLAHAFASRTINVELLDRLFDDAPQLWSTKNMGGQTPLDVLTIRGQSDWVAHIQRRLDDHLRSDPRSGDVSILLGRSAS